MDTSKENSKKNDNHSSDTKIAVEESFSHAALLIINKPIGLLEPLIFFADIKIPLLNPPDSRIERPPIT